MPLIIQEELPAFEVLKQYAFIIGKKRAIHQDIRPLEILIFNLMPVKIDTENQILSLLANSPLQINITFLYTASYIGTNTPKSHLDKFYVNFKDIKGRNFDGAIVTGAPVENLCFTEVKYWNEFCEIMDYLKKHSTSTIYLCWGAMASLYYFYNINKISLKEKMFGVFEHIIINDDLILSGLSEVITIPHSRHSGIDEKEVEKSLDLKILLKGNISGITMIRDDRDFFILGHPEYDKNTLYTEYKRDIEKGMNIKKPYNYFNKNNEPILSWRSHSSLLFINWLNFSVYQDTPFVL